MRTEWKGYLKFRLVAIPIKMYGAITAKKTVPFHLLHKACKSRIRHQNFCPTDGRDAVTLMRHADTAIYVAKSSGRKNYQFFSPR